MKTKLIISAAAVAFTLGTGCTKGCKTNNEASAPTNNTEAAEDTGQPKEEAAPSEGMGGEEEGDADSEPERKTESKEESKLKSEHNLKAGDKLIAEFDTSLGKIKAELFWDKAPMTVLNFVELAEGKKEWTDPTTKKKEKTTKPLYNGTKFHRVIKGFMIQGGDPLGNGTGGPGYNFNDEFNPALRHNAKGILSMANAGPNTNGSQFFITEVPTPHLDNRHSVFGQVFDADSLSVISKIASTETNAQDQPKTPVTINSVKIIKG